MLDKTVLRGIAEGTPVRDSEDDEGDSEFECPRCYGSHFGSSGIGTQAVERWCHDEFNRGCSWHGPTEKCFIRTYDKRTLAEALLAAYKRIEELESK